MSLGERTEAGTGRNSDTAVSRLGKSHVKAVLLIASTMTAMAGAIIAPALPGMSRHFAGESDVLVKLILTMPALMIALFSPVIGYLADRYGRKRLLLGALLLYGAAGYGGYLIDRIEVLLASRALLGIAVAGILSVSTTLIGDYFDAEERARFLGMQGSCMALGGVVFLNLGGALADWSWRGPFLIYLAGVLLLPYAWRVLPEPARSKEAAPDRGQPPASFDYWRTALAYAMALISMLLFYMIPAQLPFLLSQRVEVSGLAIGLALSAAPLTAALVSWVFGSLKSRFSVAALYVAAFLLVAAGFAMVGFAHSYAATICGIAVSGIGFGLFMPNTTTWLMSITSEGARGRVMGGFSSTFFLGQFLSPLAVAPLAVWLPTLRDIYLAAAVLCCLLAGVLAILGATLLRRPASA